jgi:hypothetical protein
MNIKVASATVSKSSIGLKRRDNAKDKYNAKDTNAKDTNAKDTNAKDTHP